MATLTGIAIKHKKRGPMNELTRAHISLDRGVENDLRGKPSKRQVTILSEKAWQDVNVILKMKLPWTTRRANLLVDDIDLENTAGKMITIGDVRLLVTQETDPCGRMREVANDLFDVLASHWRGGVCCRVICEGTVKLGDEVTIADREPEPAL